MINVNPAINCASPGLINVLDGAVPIKTLPSTASTNPIEIAIAISSFFIKSFVIVKITQSNVNLHAENQFMPNNYNQH